MYPTLLSIAGFHLSSFSIFFILAWCVFSFVFWKSLRDEGVEEERIFDLTFYGTLAALVAARLGFVASHWEEFRVALLKIPALWVAPGLSLLSAVVGGVGMMLMLGKRANVRLGAILDALGLGLPGALVVGFVGSLLDGSEVGKVTNAPWSIRYVGTPEARHPYQLYMIAALVVTLLVVGFIADQARRKKWALGSVGVGFFLLWTPLLFALEFIKDSRLYWYGLSVNQWAALILFSATVGAWYSYSGGKFVVRGVVSTGRTILSRVTRKILLQVGETRHKIFRK